MLDQYSKVVLTVIAVALSIIAIRGPLASSTVAAQSDVCGTHENPCWVAGVVDIGGPVQVVTLGSRLDVRVRDD